MSEPVSLSEGTAVETPDHPPASVKARKSFIPLECNPEVMTAMVHRLGLKSSLSFQDVFSIDDPELLAFIPRPALALLLVFPVSGTYESFRRGEDDGRPEYVGKGEEEVPVWFKQTIRNACGMIGILHAVANGDVRDSIEPESTLANLLSKALPLSPLERAKIVEDSQELEEAHKSAATQGSTPAPDAEGNVDLHYVCFVKSKDNHLYELDGRRKGPLDRGFLGEDDVLSEKAVKVVKSFISRGDGRLDFSLVALAPSLG